jgi:uncharacterized repeat protein (TIGR03943 family)
MKVLFSSLARYSRVVLYGAWFYALGGLLGDGGHETFLRPELGWLLGLGAVMLLCFGLVEMGRLGRAAKPSFPGTMRWLLLAAPLVYLLIADDVVLDAAAFDKRWTGFNGNGATGGQALVEQASAAVSDGLRSATLADLCWDAERYNGQRITVDGMIKRVQEIAEEFGPDACLLYRFVVTCCVADAMPAAILLKGDVPKEWSDDTWIRAEGTFKLETGGERDVIRLDLERATAVPRPGNPYLY